MNIQELADQAGLRSAVLLRVYGTEDALCDSEIEELRQFERFAELVAAHEREECAKFCETNQVWVGQGKRGFSKWGEEDFVAGGRHQGMDYADAIRARSKA
jgi:hypothetical protein